MIPPLFKSSPLRKKLATARNALVKQVSETLRNSRVSSRYVGPPKGFYNDLRAFEAAHPTDGSWGKTYRNLIPERCITIPSPRKVLGAGYKNYKNHPYTYFSHTGFTCLFKEARVFDHPFVFIAPDDKFIASLSSFLGSNPAEHLVLGKVHLGKAHRIKGRTLFLHENSNYWHFVHDGLSRVHLARLAGFALEDFDHILSPFPLSPTQIELFKYVGLDSAKVIPRGRHRHLLFDEILVGETAFDIRAPIWTCEYLRETLGRQIDGASPSILGKKPKRIFVTRKTRRVANEEVITPLLNDRGFQRVELDGMTFLEQKSIFENAEIIISGAGAALTNLIFCKPNCHLLILLNEELEQLEGYVEMWWVVCGLLGLPYYALFGKPSLPGQNLSIADFLIDPQKLLEILDPLLREG